MGKNRAAHAGKGGGGGAASSGPVKPKAPKKGDSSKYLYLGVAVLVGVTAVAFQLPAFRAVPPPPEPEVPAKAASRAKQEPPRQEPPRRKPKTEAPKGAFGREPIDPNCVDSDENCVAWAKSGECDRNPGFMNTSCKASCHVCNGGMPKPKKANACDDTNTNCATWAAIGECQSNPGFMLSNCPVTCKMCKSETCYDQLDDCAARCRGGAASNFSETLNCYYEPELVEKCAWTCGACKEHRFDRPACKRRAGVKPAAEPGSVNQIFGRIAKEVPGTTVLSSDPWVLTIDDFLSEDECEAVKQAGSNDGSSWARSQAGDGVQAARTSSTAWCKGACLSNPTIQAVEQRVSDLLGGIPMENAEPMQVLRYESGQFYKVHHDQNSPRSSAWGPRMFTVFMYIGGGYEGGLTHFPYAAPPPPKRPNPGTLAPAESLLSLYRSRSLSHHAHTRTCALARPPRLAGSST